MLVKLFQRLVEAGNTIIVIEHNLEVIKCADWVIDLGPEAGDEGGKLVAAGNSGSSRARSRRRTREISAEQSSRAESSGPA